MALAISVQDRYERCLSEEKHQKIQEERILSKLWFKFQFWLKNSCVHFSVNFTGRLKVRYMVQQRNIRKLSENDYYCNVLFKYAREIQIRFNEHPTFVSTNNENKIKVGEPGCPLSVVIVGENVLVANQYATQLADQNFSSVAITPTVALINDIPLKVADS